MTTERPNTVAGLKAKKAELERLRDQLEADLRSVVSDIDHLDGAIALFAKSEGHRRYVRQYRAKKGSVRRFILAMLRDATAPVSTREITDRWCKERGLATDDATWAILRNRMGATLIALRAQGLARSVGKLPDGYQGWTGAIKSDDLAEIA
jgi:hypothetical protein